MLVIANTLFQQHKRRLYTWTSPDGQHRNQTDYIICSQRWRSSIQSAKTRPRADCGSDHELLISKSRLKLKNVGKPTRPFRYDLNQTPYYYTVKVTNRFKRLDLVECLKHCRHKFITLYRKQWQKPSERKKKSTRKQVVVWGGLQIAEERREEKGKGERERYIQLSAAFQRIARGDKNTFLPKQCKEIDKNNRMENN